MQYPIENLSLLRKAIKENGIDAYIISNADPHFGEYLPAHWKIIEWLTGFTGSTATVVVTETFAGLWTDSRYFIQAEKQLQGSGCVFIDPFIFDNKDFVEWLAENLDGESTLAFDDQIISIIRQRRIIWALEEKRITYITDCDLISLLWTDRPPLPANAAFDFPVSFCGQDRVEKIAEVRKLMRLNKINYHLLTAVDDIMWLLNIRGSDYDYSPMITSFAIVGEDQILLFADEGKIPHLLAMEFDRIGVVLLPYEETAGILSTLPSESEMLISPASTSVKLFNSIPDRTVITEDISIPGRLKLIKNPVEIANIRKAMIKDGIALTKFFFWFEKNRDSMEISELLIAEKLNFFRSEQEFYLSPSFATIAAWNDHGAFPHYSATDESYSVIGEKGILLIDSGGQYKEGTTDITRTISVGSPAKQQIRDFTLVLKGTINFALAKFPPDTTGHQLDILARKSLWDNGLNYRHGTGHGVGFCLNVHEGPLSISPEEGAGSKTIIEPGMLISDEPAIYREGKYGIRIENLVLCDVFKETDFGLFLKFETVSLCYIDKSLIDISLLDQHEINWLNSYHEEVYEKLNQGLSGEEKLWLRDKTSVL